MSEHDMDDTYVPQRSSGSIGEGKSMSTQIQNCAWERFILQEKQLNHGQAKWQLFEWRTILSMSY